MIKKALKIFGYLLGVPILLILLVLLGAWLKYTHVVNSEPKNNSAEFHPGEYGKWVNNFIGTGGFPSWVCGFDFPGVTLPFGMVRLSPETASLYTNTRAYNTSGYYYGDNKIIGFSHTRLAGTGATDGGHFLVTPTIEANSEIDFNQDYYHLFSHSNEVAFPGYYSVKVDDDILCELASTQRVGIHRYTFPVDSKINILIKITNTLGNKRAENGKISINPIENEIVGSVKTYGGFSGRYGGITVYFAATFNKPFTNFGVWNGFAFLENEKTSESNDLTVSFDFEDDNSDQEIILKLGISYVSVENAKLNLQTEAESYSFDDLVRGAIDKWEERLSLIKIKGTTDEQKTIFYSALYRTFQMPTNFTDVTDQYLGFDKKIHQVTDYNYYTDLSLWDTFRNVHPLYILIAKKEQRDMIVSMLEMAKQGGWLPRWPSGGGYTNSMFGTPADVMLTGSYLKGITDFDVEFAYAKMKETALSPTPKGSPFSGRRSIESYLKYGYCPNDIKERSVSRTLEYAWSDHCIGLLANELGYQDDSKMFSKHSKFYKNLWNPVTQYFQARNSDGSFVKEFDPLQLTYTDWDGKLTRGYVEGSALQWRWAIPFDPAGLISLFRDKNYFISELNDFFELSDPKLARWNPGSYYWHGNQPDIYSAYLFNDAGRPDLTQKWVRWILENKYENSYTGIDGNDDGGTLSAWYIFSSLGLYPIAGTDIYQIGAPLFQETKVDLGDKELTIIAENFSLDNIYVTNLILNDSLINRRWIKHSEISNGGTLRFLMSDNPITK